MAHYEARRGARKEPKETELKEQLLQRCRQRPEQLQQRRPPSPPPACLLPVLQQDVEALTTQERQRD